MGGLSLSRIVRMTRRMFSYRMERPTLTCMRGNRVGAKTRGPHTFFSDKVTTPSLSAFSRCPIQSGAATSTAERMCASGFCFNDCRPLKTEPPPIFALSGFYSVGVSRSYRMVRPHAVPKYSGYTHNRNQHYVLGARAGLFRDRDLLRFSGQRLVVENAYALACHRSRHNRHSSTTWL